MYRNAYQRGMLTVFYSVGSKPLSMWDAHIQDGYITRTLDQDIKSLVYEIGGTNVSTTYITCPKDNKVLGITLPFLVMIVKNLKKYFSFEVTILDETGFRRRFRVSNFQSTTQILPFCTVVPIGLSDGWNQIQFNLAEFTRRAYKKQYVEVQNLKVNANIRLRRIYFAERLLPEDELPAEYKLFFPLSSNASKNKKQIQPTVQGKENIKPSTSISTQVVEQPILMPDKNLDVIKSSKISIHYLQEKRDQELKKDSKTEIETTKGTAETVKTENEKAEPFTDTNDKTEEQEVVRDNTIETDIVEKKSVETNTAEEETTATETIPAVADEVETVPAVTDAVETVPPEIETTQTLATDIDEKTV